MNDASNMQFDKKHMSDNVQINFERAAGRQIIYFQRANRDKNETANSEIAILITF